MKARSILITGGTGSFGSYMLRKLLGMPLAEGPERVVVLSRDEDKQHTQRHTFEDDRLSYILGDVRDPDTCRKAAWGVDYVIHAAALKQVPTGEIFPGEMTATNVQGTANLVKASADCGVKKFVLLSTDKAVYPVNAYGMSKALAEKIVLSFAGPGARRGDGATYCVVRYGNVMGSRGSVVPLFLRQIREGRPLTITDGRMTRFLLKLEEATALVLHVLENGSQGRIYSRRSPACTVSTLVKSLELHFGRELACRHVGVRPGEKLHETLLTADEAARCEEEISGDAAANITAIRSYFEYQMTSDKETLGRFGRAVPSGERDFTSEGTKQLNPAETLTLLREASLL